MAFLLPASFQKRLFRYALSQLSFLDMAAFDLDRLEGAWGRRSTGEIREIPFNIDKLTEILSLPTWVKVTKAKVLRLRLTVPLNIWSEGIEIEIDGVEIACVVDDNGPKEKGIQRGVKANQPRSTQPRKHDPGGEEHAVLPSVAAMAQSFVEHETKGDREELKTLVANQQSLEESQASINSEGSEGVGNTYTLPGLAADFLWGVGERLKMSVKSVAFEVGFQLDVPGPGSLTGTSETVTLRVTMDSLDVQGLQAASVSSAPQQPDSQLGNHCAVIKNIQGFIVSDPTLFSTFSAMSVPPSPTTTHASAFRRDVSSLSSRSAQSSDSSVQKSTSPQPRSMTDSQEMELSHATIFDAPPDAFKSAYGGDASGEHEDLDPEDEISASMMSSRYHAFGSEAGISQFEEYSSPDQSFLESGRLDPPVESLGVLQDSATLPPSLLPQRSSASERHAENLAAAEPVPSDTSSVIPSPSQLLQGIEQASQALDGQNDMQASITGQSVFHDFSNDPSPEEEVHTSHVFYDSMARSRSISPVSNRRSVHMAEDPMLAASEDTGHASPTSAAEDLAQSTLFTHEQAQSMYMSAMSEKVAAQSAEIHVPGGWDADAESEHEVQASAKPMRQSQAQHLRNDSEVTLQGQEMPRSPFVEVSKDDIVKPDRPGKDSKPEAPATAKSDGESARAIRKRFLHIETISMEVPAAIFRAKQEEGGGGGGGGEEEGDEHEATYEANSGRRSSRMPGEISMYDGLQSTLEGSTIRASITAARQETFISDKGQGYSPPSIYVNQVELVNDMGFFKLVIMSLQQLQIVAMQSSSTSNTTRDYRSRQSPQPWQLKINKMTWAFVDVLTGQLDVSSDDSALANSDVLLVTWIDDLSASRKVRDLTSVIDLSLGKYTFGYVDDPILSFDSTVKMRESVRDTMAPTSKDVSIRLVTTPGAPVDITVTTLPLHGVLDLRRLDETFSWFGGFSGMLGLGNSVMSTTTILDRNPTPKPKPTRVHFETPNKHPSQDEKPGSASDVPRITARIGGLLFELHGKSSSLNLEGSAIKLVHRTEGIGMRIDKLRCTGPVVHGSHLNPAIIVNLGPLSLRYLQTPKEKDLSRLLALLSPSSQREDNKDDDILVDTLIRQRSKGGLLRLNLDIAKGRVQRLHDLEHFSVLADEMKKLATVTKYLPEDDRPGAMILCLIKEISLDFEANRHFGTVSLSANNVQLACVTMPYLLLLGIDTIGAQHGKEILLGEVLPQQRKLHDSTETESQQYTPMVSTKFIGNEMEPTVKVRIWNLKLEYHVSTLMAAMGITESATGEVALAEMVQSVSNLTRTPTPPGLSTQTSNLSEKSTGVKSLNISLRIRDCAVGLNPRHSSAKGLLVLTNTNLTAALPRTEVSGIDANLGLNKASFMVLNDIKDLKLHGESIVPGLSFAPTYGGQKFSLARMGYVSIAEFSKASVMVQMSSKDSSGSRTMDVEVLNELFVIDSCADSTQTMLAIFAGLSPPMPPGKDLKYRTEIVPVEDMLASFTGEAFVADEDPASTYEHVVAEETNEYTSEGSPPTSLQSDPEELASKLGYAVPGAEGIFGEQSTSGKSGSSGSSCSGMLRFAESHYIPSEIWDGRAQEWNSESNSYEKASRQKVRNSPLRLRVRDVHLIWNLFDGFDWQHTRDVIGEAVADVEKRAVERQAKRNSRRSIDLDEDEDSVIGDFLFNSIYIGVGTKNDPRDLARQVNRNLADNISESDSFATPTTVVSRSPSGRGLTTRRKRLRLERSKHHKMTFELKGVSADVVVFPPGSGETQTSIDVRVRDLEIFDHIHTSTWKKFATYMHDAGEREADMPMVHIELLNVKPVPDLAASELVLRASVLPLRLHVDQDTLDFITRFFEFKDSAQSEPSTPTVPSEQPFFQRAEINSIPIKLDFKPKRVDYAGLRSGRTTEFMNFIILDGADMVLQHVIIYGVSGFDRLGRTLNDIWMPDVKRNQLPGVLAGLAPVRGLVNVGSGVRDLVVVPMREYRKDGRLVRAIQKGAVAFAKTTTTELTRLGARLALGTQNVLQNTEDLLSGQPSGSDDDYYYSRNVGQPSPGVDEERPQQISQYADQPLGVVAGLRGAYRHLERDLLLARDAIIAMPGEVMESGSAGGAAKAVLRGAPIVILRPAMGVTRAVGTTLMGATNALDKKERRRVEDKYKRV